jgi:hypothetical protein
MLSVNETNAPSVHPPTPISCKIEEGHGEARFDLKELKAYLDTTSDKSWIVRDEKSNVVGVASVALMKKSWLA